MADTVFSAAFVSAAIPISAVIGILFAIFLWRRVAQVRGWALWLGGGRTAR